MASQDNRPSYIALLGGSFNPPHIGHFRLAVEVCEHIQPDAVWFIPTATPPHKGTGNLLSFDCRLSLLEEAVKRIPTAEICTMEQDRTGPSYTVDTLMQLRALHPAAKFGFILGSEDIPLLPTWNRWEQLLDSADLLVLPRGSGTYAAFRQNAAAVWPRAVEGTWRGLPTLTPPGQHNLVYIDQPGLEISSSLVRNRFLAGKSIDFLVPDSVLFQLRNKKPYINACWSQPENSER